MNYETKYSLWLEYLETSKSLYLFNDWLRERVDNLEDEENNFEIAKDIVSTLGFKPQTVQEFIFKGKYKKSLKKDSDIVILVDSANKGRYYSKYFYVVLNYNGEDKLPRGNMDNYILHSCGEYDSKIGTIKYAVSSCEIDSGD